MIFKICLIVLSAFTLVFAGNSDSCSASKGWENMCYQSISTNCKNASLLVDKPQWKSCQPAQLFWNYPRNNLTTTFIPPPKSSSIKPQSYQFCLQEISSQCTQVFRVLQNGKTTKVTWSGSSPTCFTNEISDNYFKFRFHSGDSLVCYGVFIRYSIK